MSMKIECVRGFGFPIGADDAALARFAVAHAAAVEASGPRGGEIVEAARRAVRDGGDTTFEDGLAEREIWIESRESGREGKYALVANVMGEETGIGFDYAPPDEDGKEYILFPEGYPWDRGKKNLGLTLCGLTEIMKLYADELDSPASDFAELFYCV